MATDEAFQDPAIRSVHDLEQVLIALVFDGFFDLIWHVRGGSTAPGRIAKDKRIIKLDLFSQVSCLAVIILRFAGKTDDNVGRDRNAVARPPDSPDQIDVFLCGVWSAHGFENLVRTGLRWQMNVLGEF